MRTLLLLVLASLAVAGCASEAVVVPATVKAPPQTARPDWKEPYPAVAPALVFGVTRFTVTREGWKADISVENRSGVGWKVGDLRAGGQAFGVLLFPDDDLDALERRSRSGDLPAIRAATSYNPALPLVLGPDKTWQGTIAAPGALAGGLWIRLSFGPFISVGKPPEGAAAQVVWFTDHALRLEQVAAEPA
ncbi:MAG: hypothetical protein EXQ81_07470 [Thermoleophilia bacterium]|nr:hypothetical protein [Thermoleophilia bacterium]